MLDLVEINGTMIQSGSQMGGGGIRKDLRHGQSFLIFPGERDFHNAPMQVYIFGMPHISCLDKLLRNGSFAVFIPFACQVAGRVTFAGIGIDTAYKIYILFHTFFFFAMI